MNPASQQPGDWQGGPVRHLTPKILRWFRELVRYQLSDAAISLGVKLPAAVLDTATESFLEAPERFLCWVPDESYRPGSYTAPGEWTPRKRLDDVIKEVVTVLVATEQARRERAKHMPKVDSIEPVPPADIDAALAELASGEGPEEAMAWQLLGARAAHLRALGERRPPPVGARGIPG